MIWLRYAGALALLTAANASAQDAEPTTAPLATDTAAPVTLSEGELFQLQPDRYRRMTVPVTIGGEGPFNFMIDTGSQATVLSQELANRLDLQGRQPATLVGMASSRPVQTTQVHGLMLGNRTITIARAPLVPAQNIGGADGILGLDSLQDSRVLLDIASRQLEVASTRDSGSNDGFDIVVRARSELGQLVITQAELNGIRIALVVDTGAQGSVGNDALLRRLRRAEHGGEAELTDINGVMASGNTRIARSLEIGRAQLANFPVTFARSPTFAALDLEDRPALLLGMNELRAFARVAIDFASSRVLFDLPSGTRLSHVQGFGRLSR